MNKFICRSFASRAWPRRKFPQVWLVSKSCRYGIGHSRASEHSAAPLLGAVWWLGADRIADTMFAVSSHLITGRTILILPVPGVRNRTLPNEKTRW